MKRIHVFTLVPDAFGWFLRQHPLSTAIDNGSLTIGIHNIREYSPLPHHEVDDSPYGGGPGMVTRVDIVGMALEGVFGVPAATVRDTRDVYVLAAAGRPFDHSAGLSLAASERDLVLLCGRFEGFDARVEGLFATGSLSIGPYVLAGGRGGGARGHGGCGPPHTRVSRQRGQRPGGIVQRGAGRHGGIPALHAASGIRRRGGARGAAQRGPWGDRQVAAAEYLPVAMGFRRARPMSEDVDQEPRLEVTAPVPAEPSDVSVETPGAKRSSIPGTIVEIVVIVAAAFVIALLVQAFLVKPFTIHQVSMRATLEEGDRILLNRLSYRFRDEDRGDIVVFRSPIDPDEDLVKRIVAVGNDRVAISAGKLYVNGVAQDEPYLLEQDFSGDVPETVVPPGMVFVMGDNRDNSGDSRLFGPIPTDTIIGSALVVYWPIGHWKTL